MEVAIASPARSSAVVPTRRHHRILIIGGGTAGVTLAARLRHAGQSDIALLEPSEQHFYQPLWTLVGAGQVRIEDTVRAERDYIPAGGERMDFIPHILSVFRRVVDARGEGTSLPPPHVPSGS